MKKVNKRLGFDDGFIIKKVQQQEELLQDLKATEGKKDDSTGSRFSRVKFTGTGISREKPTGSRFSREESTGSRFSREEPTGSRFSREEPTGSRFSREDPTALGYRVQQAGGHSC